MLGVVTQTVHAYALTEKLGCWLKGGYMFALLHMAHIKEQITYASLNAKKIVVEKFLKLIWCTHITFGNRMMAVSTSILCLE